MKKKEPGGSRTEAQEQKSVVKWAEDPKTQTIHPELKALFYVGNQSTWRSGSAEARKYGSIANAMGRKKGVPDLCLPIPKGGKSGLWIEMKTKDGKISEHQHEYFQLLANYGHVIIIARSDIEAIDAIISYLEPGSP